MTAIAAMPAIDYPVIVGKMSTFGGPYDSPAAGNNWPGGYESEGLALLEERHVADPRWSGLFLPEAVEGLPGLARRLNPDRFYVAFRWNKKADAAEREQLRNALVVVRNPKTGQRANARIVDWGPAESTGRVADLSPGLARFLGLQTDDEVELTLTIAGTMPPPTEPYIPYDPRDHHTPAMHKGEPLLNIILKLLAPLAIGFFTNAGSSIFSGLFAKILAPITKLFGAVGKTEATVPKGTPAADKQANALEQLVGKDILALDFTGILKAILGWLIDAAVGYLNGKVTKDWAPLLAETAGDGKAIVKAVTK